MMFGSDWPVCLLAASYDQVLESFHLLLAGLSKTERNAVFGENATEFYRLHPVASTVEHQAGRYRARF
jgi:L-fuconolactonase